MDDLIFIQNVKDHSKGMGLSLDRAITYYINDLVADPKITSEYLIKLLEKYPDARFNGHAIDSLCQNKQYEVIEIIKKQDRFEMGGEWAYNEVYLKRRQKD